LTENLQGQGAKRQAPLS